jgi:putative transcriptional regulator
MVRVMSVVCNIGIKAEKRTGSSFSVNTLRHWEQGKPQPEGPTCAYLLVIDRAPKVQKSLRAVLDDRAAHS